MGSTDDNHTDFDLKPTDDAYDTTPTVPRPGPRTLLVDLAKMI